MTDPPPAVTTWAMPAPPAPGAPYTLWLASEWYLPETQESLTALGFQFGPPNAYGNAAPLHDQVLIEDLRISELIALIRPLRMTCAITEVRNWYGQSVPPATVWVVRLGYQAGV